MKKAGLVAIALAIGLLSPVLAQTDDAHHMHHHDQSQAGPHGQHDAIDSRQAVTFPRQLKAHTLANMRDHLQTLTDIQEALSLSDFEKAATLAESRLGMSSLEAHGAHDVARYMPKGMQQLGAAMHQNASRFAVQAQDASASGDIAAALRALAKVNGSCVACHAAYRLQ